MTVPPPLAPGVGHGQVEPSAWVARFCGLAPAGRTVLDLACGGGRHARHLLDRGHVVLAVDRDTAPVFAAIGDRAGLEVLTVDLEATTPFGADGSLAGRRFGAVVVTNYLHRPLMPGLLAAIESGGVLIYETFASGNERFGKPSNPDFLLRPGELLDVVRGRLDVVAYEHGIVETPRPAVVQRICARSTRDAAPVKLG